MVELLNDFEIKQVQLRWKLMNDKINNATPKVRILAAQSGKPTPRRLFLQLEAIPLPLSESTMELDKPLPPENTTGTITPSDHDYAMVALSNMVPNNPTNEYWSTNATATDSYSTFYANSNLADDKQSLWNR